MKFLQHILFCLLVVSYDASASISPNDLAREYVKLVLAVGKFDNNYVDAYYGPSYLQKEVDDNPLTIEEISTKSELLANNIALWDPGSALPDRLRKHYLVTQLAALSYHVEFLSGKAKKSQRDFDAEAVKLYNTLPPTYDFQRFDNALMKIDALLPGDAPLDVRVGMLLEKVKIPVEKLPIVFERAIEECRKRTKAFISLPDNESFSLEYVTNKAWSGYNWYQGKSKSLIQINTDFPVLISRAVDLGAHEGYPGHHTYNALLEDSLANKLGWIEMTVYPLFSPQSLIAEGSANYGIEMVFPGDEKEKFEREVLAPLAGISEGDLMLYNQYQDLKEGLSYAGNEIARLYINGQLSREDAIRLQAKYSLEGTAKAEQRISFVEAYGAYVINYNWGKDMVKRYIEDNATTHEERWLLFNRLLSSPRLPSSLSWE